MKMSLLKTKPVIRESGNLFRFQRISRCFFALIAALAFSTPQPVNAQAPAGTVIAPIVSHSVNAEPSLPDWRTLPVLPETVSDDLRALYRNGLRNGNDPTRFGKIGDSNSVRPSFLACFDDLDGYDLGEYTFLENALLRYAGSFERPSRATANGMTARRLIDEPHWYKDNECGENESAVACELRIWRPSIVFIALGTNDVYRAVDLFTAAYRKIVDTVLASGAVPILILKADDLDRDGSFNHAIAKIGAEKNLPVVNLWRAMQPLPDHGLRGDHAHPSAGSPELCNLTGDELRQYGWPVRNLTSLLALNRIVVLLEK